MNTFHKVFDTTATVQNAMQRFLLTNTSPESADFSNAPGAESAPETVKMVPDSFDEWLARPSETITSNQQPDQTVFAELMKECPPRVNGNSSIRVRR